MTLLTSPDQDSAGVAGRLMQDLEGLSATVLAILGDRLGLFRSLATHPGQSAAELAARASATERYTLEWARGLVTAGYLQHDETTGTFALTPGAETVLGGDASALSMGGGYEFVGALLRKLDDVEFAFRHGGGVPQTLYGSDCVEGMARMSAPRFEHSLVQAWVPQVDGLADRLQRGARVVDIGCGAGGAVETMARAFPASTFVGVDILAEALDSARRRVQLPNVTWVHADAAAGLVGRFDVVTAFDVIHDAADPGALLRAIRAAVAHDGVFLALEPQAGGPRAVTNYAYSLLYSLSVSLARGGAGLGACALDEDALRRLAVEAGFSSVRQLTVPVLGSALFEVRP